MSQRPGETTPTQVRPSSASLADVKKSIYRRTESDSTRVLSSSVAAATAMTSADHVMSARISEQPPSSPTPPYAFPCIVRTVAVTSSWRLGAQTDNAILTLARRPRRRLLTPVKQ